MTTIPTLWLLGIGAAVAATVAVIAAYIASKTER